MRLMDVSRGEFTDVSGSPELPKLPNKLMGPTSRVRVRVGVRVRVLNGASDGRL